MKQLFIIRHAKSSWSSPSLSDFDRPLNERGKTDAPDMARRLKGRKIEPDLLVSSPAMRAWSTMQYFAKAFHMPPNQILKMDALYHAPAHVFYDTIKDLQLHNESTSVALFSHNPGITDFVNSLGLARLDNMPTCGIFALKIDTQDWATFEQAEKTFLFFDYPKLSV